MPDNTWAMSNLCQIIFYKYKNQHKIYQKSINSDPGLSCFHASSKQQFRVQVWPSSIISKILNSYLSLWSLPWIPAARKRVCMRPVDSPVQRLAIPIQFQALRKNKHQRVSHEKSNSQCGTVLILGWYWEQIAASDHKNKQLFTYWENCIIPSCGVCAWALPA